jgi:uncharacterized membrane protein
MSLVNNSGRVQFWQIVRELRGGFVLRPGAITLGMAALAVGLSLAEEWITAVPGWADVLDRLFPPEPAAAHVVLGTIASSMMAVVSVVYSILLVVLTFASAQFSPRVLVAFVEDRVSQTTLGIFVGTFTYCLLTLPFVRSRPEPFVPSVALIVAIALAVACLASLLFFIHHITVSIQASHIVDRIARDTERVLDQVFPPVTVVAQEEGPLEPPASYTTVCASKSGYIRVINEDKLLATARFHDVTLYLGRHIGQFAAEGTPVLTVSPADRATELLRAASLSAFDIGPTRTMDQDVEFGVLQIVDIALKAISPAVNDPTTAITCLDQLGRILVRAATRESPSPLLRDPTGRVRVVMRRTSFPRLLDVAFSQIRHYGKTDVAVPLRLMRVLSELVSATRQPLHADAVREHARRLAAACADGFPDTDRDELHERLTIVERTVTSFTPE